MDYHRDHPDVYFRRLQSYSGSRSSIPQGPRAHPRSGSRTNSYSPSKSRPYIDSRTNSYADTLDGSEVTRPKNTKRRSRRDSYASPQEQSEAVQSEKVQRRSRRDSYTETREASDVAPPEKAQHRSRRDSHSEARETSEVSLPQKTQRRSRRDSYAELPEVSDVAPPKHTKRRSRHGSPASLVPDSPYGSEAIPPKKSKRRQRPDSLASLHPDLTPPARPESHVSTRPSSYLSSRPQSYADTDALTHDFNEKSEYGDYSPKRINAELLRRYDDLQHGRTKKWWTRRRKIWIGIVVAILALIIIIVGAVVGTRKSFNYTPSDAQVNNTIAFQKGGATRQSVNVTNDGIGAGQDVYTYYTGGPTRFPDASRWVSFQDMWNANLPNIQKSCGWLGYPPDNSPTDDAYLFDAIQDRANASLVDHRYILAIVLQESHGCVNVGGTTSSGGVTNPGLMQSHNGDSYSKKNPWLSILLMIQDGVQGTKYGDGLVQLLNTYGDPYSAARGYNSGYIPKSGNLSEAAGATACYVSDVANRLTGWVNAKSTCPGAD